MENNKPYYVTYKFYDERGRRLSIFALPIYTIGELESEMPKDPNSLVITIIPCSKKDTFSKKVGTEEFEIYKSVIMQGFEGSSGVTELQIPIVDGKPKTTFLRWCEATYFKYQPTVFAVEAPALWRGDEMTDANFKELKVLPIEVEEEGDLLSDVNEN